MSAADMFSALGAPIATHQYVPDRRTYDFRLGSPDSYCISCTVTESDGSVRVAVSRNPSSGNWIRPPESGAFTLLFTVAETAATQQPQSAPSFTIGRSKC